MWIDLVVRFFHSSCTEHGAPFSLNTCVFSTYGRFSSLISMSLIITCPCVSGICIHCIVNILDWSPYLIFSFICGHIHVYYMCVWNTFWKFSLPSENFLWLCLPTPVFNFLYQQSYFKPWLLLILWLYCLLLSNSILFFLCLEDIVSSHIWKHTNT